MPLRKALIRTAAFTDNAGSFVNETSKRLHIRKLVGSMQATAALVLGDLARMSIDEVPTDTSDDDDSRSHLMVLTYSVNGGTGALQGPTQRQVLSFNRGDLVLDPDEAIFMNTRDSVGAPNLSMNLNIWYED